MTRKQFILSYRIVAILAVVAAISFQMAHSQVYAQSFSKVNFFSFFSIEANLIAAVTFIMSAYSLYKARTDSELESLRGAATLYMVVTGLVYSMLLTGVEVQNSVAWANIVVHYAFPVVVLADWLYVRPVRKFTSQDVMLWLIFPLLYVSYTLIRGPRAHDWYPYPFINVAKHGLGEVLLNCVILAIVMGVLALGIAKAPTFVAMQLKRQQPKAKLAPVKKQARTVTAKKKSTRKKPTTKTKKS